ncbi:MAG: Cna B-type domain-containing protein [Clostridia bacterium]|nr:Cna B-type domain-containing protein [Clostridia bacterium]
MKKILVFLITLALLLQMGGTLAFAEDGEQTATLTVVYKAEELLFDGLEISLFRVADIGADGAYTLSGDFKDYPVDVKVVKSQEEWRTIATTLTAYIVADGISPAATVKTDEEGKAVFEGLSKGLYLVYGVQSEKNDLIYSFESFFSSLPRPDADGNPQYEVTALPKHTTHVPEPDELEYKVVKQWKDSSSDKRPTSIEIEIFKDGKTVETQTLSAENNWSYSWKAADDGSKWTVVERNIAENYTVSVTEEDTAFIVTNTFKTVIPLPPMGDVAVVWPYVLALFSVGAILMLLSVGIKRKAND